ncbi:MAG: MCE family protein [Thermoleophilia bacterium]|nr:MCE family protein [Thermoleophilia bacterium]
MNAGLVRMSVFAIVALISFAAVVLVVTSSKEVGGTEVRAEFEDGWPLLEGMSVRMSGGVVGKVNRLELSDEGRAVVTIDLDEDAPALGADASVAVRQQDLLGDTYLDLSPGRSARPLRETIPVSRTIARPRLDDVLSTVTPAVRNGFQMYVMEIAAALEERGADLNDTILLMRPGLKASTDLLAEFKGQNRSLERALVNARKVTSQVAGRSADLDAAIRNIDATTSEVSAAAPSLRQALARAPRTLRKAESSLRGVRTMLQAAGEVSDEVGGNAEQLEAVTDALIRFPDSAVPALKDVTSLINASRTSIKKGAPSFRVLANTDFSLLPRATEGIDTLSLILGELMPAVLGDPVKGGGYYGGTPRSERWPTDAKTDPARAYLPVKVVLSCETFGVPIEPGCLTKAGLDESSIPTVPGTTTAAGRRAVAKRARDKQAWERDQQTVIDYLLGP